MVRKHGGKRTPELSTHAAVDEEVDWVADGNEEIDEQCRRVAGVVRVQINADRVLNDHHHKDNNKRNLNNEEQPDDRH